MRGCARGREPPHSCYPTLADGTLVDPREAAFSFPALAALGSPTAPRVVRRWTFGQRRAEGIVDRPVPALGAPYPTLVPAVDADGNELKGIRLPEVAVPLGTFVGWRLRTPETGATLGFGWSLGCMAALCRLGARRDGFASVHCPSLRRRGRVCDALCRRSEGPRSRGISVGTRRGARS